MKNRYLSLDIFRGATVALMIFVNNPGTFSHMYWPLDHAKWNGLTLADLVFPFFLFAVGNAMAFVMPGLKEKGDSSFFIKVFKRSAIIFSIGLLLNWTPFVKWDNDHLIFKDWGHLRIMGVLQRIAICYLLASMLAYFLDTRKAWITGSAILLGYWAICWFYGNPAGPYTLQGYYGTDVDKMLLGEKHLYAGEGLPFDPEGLSSTFAAVVQVLFGYLAGQMIIKHGKTQEMVNRLFYFGAILVVIGLCWNIFFPVNKKIWTSSYTVLTTGMAMIIIACLIYQIEFKNHRGKWMSFFDVFGKNPLFIFVLSGLIPRLLGLIRIPAVNDKGKQIYLSPLSWIYENVFKNIHHDLRVGSLAYSFFFITCLWAIGYYLYKKKIFIKV